MNTQRPLTVTIAAVLLALQSLVNLMPPFIFGVSTESAGAFFVYLTVIFGVVGLIAAYGLWMLKRWSIWFTIVVCVLNLLSAAPGVAFAPSPAWQAAAIATVVGNALFILLVALPNSRRAYA